MTYVTLTESSSASQNILDNAGFEIWQRGTTFNTIGNNVYTADRWIAARSNPGGTPGVNITQDSSIVDSGTYSLKINVASNAGGGNPTNNTAYIYQFVENPSWYAGKTVTLYGRLWCNAAGIASLTVGDGLTTSFSTNHTGNSTWQTFTVSKTLSTSLTSLNVGAGFGNGGAAAGSICYIDSLMLVIGSQPVNFAPIHPALDWERCLRYYEAGTLDMLHPVWSNASNALTCYYAKDFRVMKASTPTVTLTKPTSIFLNNLSPNSTGGTNGAYTPDASSNWTASSGAVTNGSFQCTMSRASASPSVSNLMESAPTWIASADL